MGRGVICGSRGRGEALKIREGAGCLRGGILMVETGMGLEGDIMVYKDGLVYVRWRPRGKAGCRNVSGKRRKQNFVGGRAVKNWIHMRF